MVYFLSDAHLGSRLIKNQRAHEKMLVDWLDKIKVDASSVVLLGDIFDFWFEYRTVVPKGFTRLLGKLGELVDKGIAIHFFTGNHDIWTFGYFEEEIGLIVHRSPIVLELEGKKFFLAHGDGLDANDHGFKLLRKIFHSKAAHNVFRLIPPRLGQEWGYNWSRKNREKIIHFENKYMGEDREALVVFAKKYAQENTDIDFFVFGHRHIPLDLQIRNNKRVVILGDFVSVFSYGVFDGNDFRLEYMENIPTDTIYFH